MKKDANAEPDPRPLANTRETNGCAQAGKYALLHAVAYCSMLVEDFHILFPFFNHKTARSNKQDPGDNHGFPNCI
jgi:hypothetical protein